MLQKKIFGPGTLFLSAIGFLIILLTCSTTCKKNNSGGARLSTVNPFKQWLANTGDTATLTNSANGLPLELGYSFTASDTGTVYQIGLRLPDTGRTYTVSLWDGATQNLLIQKDVKNAIIGFSYIDLNATNEAVHILANHLYVIGVYTVPVGIVGAGPAGDNYYAIRRTDQKDIFPMTEGYITYQHQYGKTSYTPAFPDNLSVYQDFIDGICDIGFSHVTQ
jgi:hypothetical protein